MKLTFVDRNPTQAEIEKLRLVLSTYQDGSGQLVTKNGKTLPGWRDFERAFAATFGGKAQESKFIFDVLLTDAERPGIHYGISCKMRRTLSDTFRTGRVTLELSNSSGQFWRALEQRGLNQQNYKDKPNLAGEVLIDVVREWHDAVGFERGGSIDLSKSLYLALSWNKSGQYQLFKFALALPNSNTLQWDFPNAESNGEIRVGRRLRGKDEIGTLFEWYGESGGQLKYYPLASNAPWTSDIFQLEPLPEENVERYGVLAKAQAYFPKQWKSAS